MIFDPLGQYHTYALGPIWLAVMDFLSTLGANAEPAQHRVAGCTVNVFKGETTLFTTGRYETHRNMVDVQMVLSGSEYFFYAPAAYLSPDGDFIEDRDVGFYHTPDQEYARLTLSPGMFALVFPRDAHMPMIAVDGKPAPVLKAVAKIPMELLLPVCNAR